MRRQLHAWLTAYPQLGRLFFWVVGALCLLFEIFDICLHALGIPHPWL